MRNNLAARCMLGKKGLLTPWADASACFAKRDLSGRIEPPVRGRLPEGHAHTCGYRPYGRCLAERNPCPRTRRLLAFRRLHHVCPTECHSDSTFNHNLRFQWQRVRRLNRWVSAAHSSRSPLNRAVAPLDRYPLPTARDLAANGILCRLDIPCRIRNTANT